MRTPKTEVIRRQMNRAQVGRVPGRGRPRLVPISSSQPVQIQEEIVQEVVEEVLPLRRKRGRPKGAKNRKKSPVKSYCHMKLRPKKQRAKRKVR